MTYKELLSCWQAVRPTTRRYIIDDLNATISLFENVGGKRFRQNIVMYSVSRDEEGLTLKDDIFLKIESMAGEIAKNEVFYLAKGYTMWQGENKR